MICAICVFLCTESLADEDAVANLIPCDMCAYGLDDARVGRARDEGVGRRWWGAAFSDLGFNGVDADEGDFD